jgi:CHAT domain-containing protein
MRNRRAEQTALSIYFGKEAINNYQLIRANMLSLDKELQKSFVDSKEKYYHELASLMIDQGRLPEAEQVLDLLEQQEYTDYVRGSPSTMLGQLSLTPAERQAEEDYQKSMPQLVTEEQQWTQLKKTTARTPEQEKKYQQLSDELAQANQGMNDYYTRLYKLFGKNGGANKQVADVQGDAAVLRQQIAKMLHTVALCTVIAEDRYSVVMIAGNAPMAGRRFDITDHDLNLKIAAFQQVLRDPSKDPKPLGQELYKILIGPVKSDLDQAQAETLVFSLDGALRYIPMAALYDGRHYLVENYNLVAFTPPSIWHLSDKPQLSDVSAVAMGISRKYEDGLNPLPTVVTELDDIIHDPQVKNANGVLPGTILLNGQFTERAMESQLDGQHAIVHIASHFVLKPGDDNASYHCWRARTPTARAIT